MNSKHILISFNDLSNFTSWVKKTGFNFVWKPWWHLQTGTDLVEPEYAGKVSLDIDEKKINKQMNKYKNQHSPVQ